MNRRVCGSLRRLGNGNKVVLLGYSYSFSYAIMVDLVKIIAKVYLYSLKVLWSPQLKFLGKTLILRYTDILSRQDSF